jgi:hypothetical protein
LVIKMVFFNNNTEAKARRTQALDEQQKKKAEEPTPYFHTPTHAYKDALLSFPGACEGTDSKKLEKAHQQRLEREISCLAGGSDHNSTRTPANYWQGRTLPAQFSAPTPANLRKMALSQPAVRERNIKLREPSPLQQQLRAPSDEGERKRRIRETQKTLIHTSNRICIDNQP